MQMFLLFLLAVLVAVYGSQIAEFLQERLRFFDDMEVKKKRVCIAMLIYGLSVLMYKLFNLTGLFDVQNLAREQLSSLFSVGLAYVFHTQDKLKQDL